MYSIVNGAVWAAIPNGLCRSQAIVLIAVGLGIWSYNLNQENTHLQKVEWLYRYERVSYDADGIRNDAPRRSHDGWLSRAGQHQDYDNPA